MKSPLERGLVEAYEDLIAEEEAKVEEVTKTIGKYSRSIHNC